MVGLQKPRWVRHSIKRRTSVDWADGASVFVLFILVWPLFFRDAAPCTEGNKEQVLASLVPGVVILRSVRILVGPLPPRPCLNFPTAFLNPKHSGPVRNPSRNGSRQL